jgi:hypothetical protein
VGAGVGFAALVSLDAPPLFAAAPSVEDVVDEAGAGVASLDFFSASIPFFRPSDG